MTPETNDRFWDEAYGVIEGIAKSREKSGAFAYYTGRDIYQEVWKLCLEAISSYDPSIGFLENFLNHHVANRLKNLKRDKYFRPGIDAASSGHARTRMNLVNAIPFEIAGASNKDVVLGSASCGCDPLDELICNETASYIRNKLPDHLIRPFDELISNGKVRQPTLKTIRVAVAEILRQRGLDDDG